MSSPAYSKLPTYEQPAFEPVASKDVKKRRLFYLLACTLLAVGTFAVVRHTPFAGRVLAACGGASSKPKYELPTHYTLSSGDKIPSVALGVWQAAPGEVGTAIKTALDAGYRHIDGAWIYRNEAEVGAALKESSVPREDIWITSKLWNTFHAPEDVEAALDDTLGKLQTDYLDLYLMHWPVALKKGTTEVDMELTDDPLPTWRKLEEMVEKGKVKNIGVSNFNGRRILNLTANPLKIKPVINQVELNFFNPQSELLAFAKQNDILLEAYSPFGSTNQVGRSLNVPVVKDVAEKLGITPAQVLLSWHVQRGTAVLPKSVTPSRIKENLAVVALPEEDFELIEAAANSVPAERVINPSKNWYLGYDLYDEHKM